MRIVFSRKGFDSVYGRVPSPIFPGDRMCFLPIPSPNERIKYSDVSCEGQNLGKIVESLPQRRVCKESSVHLDPDLDHDAYPREAGWRGIFGQTGAAQSHLKNRGVTQEDIFLFFGWYKRVDVIGGRISYVAEAPDLHVLFGWMQIGSIHRVDSLQPSALRWARYHSHLDPDRAPNPLNTVYVARTELALPGMRGTVPGAGLFRTFRSNLCLTAPNARGRSEWRLPKWFYPPCRERALSYHADMRRWRRGTNSVYLKTVGRGQEFVLDCDSYPPALDWLKELLGGQ